MKCKKCEKRDQYIRNIQYDTLRRMKRLKEDAERTNNQKAVFQLNELIKQKEFELNIGG
tara:strand:- start:1121 stop:1297 length:177 start_codon:yes stop_codon:yes gene_type:complete